MSASLYSQKVIDHFSNPRNVGTLDNADGVGEVGNITCGDIMRIYIKVDKDGDTERIGDIRFQTFGCDAAVATSSIITEMVKGMTLEESMNITNKDVAEALDGLPPVKMHCSNLAADALKAAINDYRQRQNSKE
ncbi:MAG: Fe-S cluster assembly scaffold protein NifU [Firmicutes bacterium]|nr:Fe-S cluster assembly scaffold protein NifU [Bacillota bacterium]